VRNARLPNLTGNWDAIEVPRVLSAAVTTGSYGEGGGPQVLDDWLGDYTR
jgi:hypothetical protein